MLDLRYDPVSRSGYVRLRQGKVARTRELSPTANGEYDSRDRLVAIQISDLNETAPEFLRTADEETLLRVIREQAGRRKAGSQPPPSACANLVAGAEAHANGQCLEADGSYRQDALLPLDQVELRAHDLHRDGRPRESGIDRKQRHQRFELLAAEPWAMAQRT